MWSTDCVTLVFPFPWTISVLVILHSICSQKCLLTFWKSTCAFWKTSMNQTKNPKILSILLSIWQNGSTCLLLQKVLKPLNRLSICAVLAATTGRAISSPSHSLLKNMKNAWINLAMPWSQPPIKTPLCRLRICTAAIPPLTRFSICSPCLLLLWNFAVTIWKFCGWTSISMMKSWKTVRNLSPQPATRLILFFRKTETECWQNWKI